MAISDCNFEQLKIDKKYISLFASGLSINNITLKEFEYLKERTFMVGTNYFLLYHVPHLIVFSDVKTMRWHRDKYFSTNAKKCLIMTRKESFEEDAKDAFKQDIDFWYNTQHYKLLSNYTAIWMVQLFRKFFPDRQLLLFGFDFYIPDNVEKYKTGVLKAKCYDYKTEYDLSDRKMGKYKGHLDKFEKDLFVCKEKIPGFVDNVWNCNLISRTTAFRKRNYREVLEGTHMRILHLCNSALAGAPTHLSKIINKYTEHESVTVLARRFSSEGLRHLSWTYDYIGPSEAEVSKLVDISDIIHFHNIPLYSGMKFTKASVIQFHSQPEHHPGVYKPNITYKEFNGKKLVIAQYHPRYYTDAAIVPNMIDIWDDMYKKESFNNGRLTIFFGYASEAKGWAYKGVKEITKILEGFKKVCNIHIVTNKPYADMMAIKRKADIVIGDCITGSYHLADLEGAAVGAIVFNNLDDKTKACMKEVTKVGTNPFQQTKLSNLKHAIEYFIDEPNRRLTRSKRNREWMEENWNPNKLVKHYINHYERVLT